MKHLALIISIFTLLITTSNSLHSNPIEEKYISAKKGINLRSEPSTNGKIITIIPYKTKVTVENKSNEKIFISEMFGSWVFINWNNKKGWVFDAFLCDFNPDSIIPIAAKYYTKYFNDNWKKFCGYEEGKKQIIPVKSSDISIKSIINNYILLEVPQAWDLCDFNKADVLWIYNKTNNTFKESFSNDGHAQNIKMIYLNNDTYPDLITSSGCCGSWEIKVYLLQSDEVFKLDKTIECGESNDVKGIDEPLCEEKNIYKFYKNQN